jgi:CPA2 family monovalent cation:H+ antiporter-2
MVVGPAGFNLVTLEGDIEVLSEVGVALLLFVLGVEFSLKDLLRVRAIAFGGGTLQIILTIFLGGGLAYLTDWVSTLPKAIFLGAVISLSSTAVVFKSLIERNEVQTAHGQIMLGILIVQDLSLGLMLAVLPALTQPPDVIGIALIGALLKALVFVGGAIIAGKWFIPFSVRLLAQSGSQDLFILGIVLLCLGIALPLRLAWGLRWGHLLLG